MMNNLNEATKRIRPLRHHTLPMIPNHMFDYACNHALNN